MPTTLPPLVIADLAFIALALLLIHFARRWVPLYALLVLPGTLLHEASHWLVAAVLGGQPTSLHVMPTRSERGWQLGAVGVRRVRWFNALPIGLAPLLLAPLAWVALLQAVSIEPASWLHWAVLYVATIAAVSCVPSRADLRIVLSRPLGLLLYVAIAAAAAWFLWRG